MLVNFLYQLLKSPAGKFSRKSFMIIVSFLITMSTGVLIIIADCFLKYEPTSKSLEVFDSLLLFLIALVTGTVIDKKITSKKDINKTED